MAMAYPPPLEIEEERQTSPKRKMTWDEFLAWTDEDTHLDALRELKIL